MRLLGALLFWAAFALTGCGPHCRLGTCCPPPDPLPGQWDQARAVAWREMGGFAHRCDHPPRVVIEPPQCTSPSGAPGLKLMSVGRCVSAYTVGGVVHLPVTGARPSADDRLVHELNHVRLGRAGVPVSAQHCDCTDPAAVDPSWCPGGLVERTVAKLRGAGL